MESMISAGDVYALGLAVGEILRDWDDPRREAVLNLISLLERKAGAGISDAQTRGGLI